MIPESRQEPTVSRVKDHTRPHPAATLRFLQFNIALLSPHNPHIVFVFLSSVTVRLPAKLTNKLYRSMI